MELALYTFLTDKKKFIQSVAEKKIPINPSIAGLILSHAIDDQVYNNYYLESLKHSVFNLTDSSQISYCLARFYKIVCEILKKFQKSSKLLEVYMEISLKSTAIPISHNLIKYIQDYFTKSFNILLNLYSNSFEFLQIVEVGSKNLKFFKECPAVLTNPLLKSLLSIKILQEIQNFPEFLENFKVIGNFIMKSSNPDTKILANFLFFLTEFECKSRNFEFLEFIQKNVNVLARCFSEENMEIIKNILKEPRLYAEAPEFIPQFKGIFKDAEIKYKIEESQQDHNTISNSHQDTSMKLSLALVELYDYYKESRFIDSELIKTFLTNSNILYLELKPVIKFVVLDLMTDKIPNHDLEFWSSALEALKDQLSSEDFAQLHSCIPQHSRSSDLSLSKNANSQYSRRSRPSSRLSTPNKFIKNEYTNHSPPTTIEFIPQAEIFSEKEKIVVELNYQAQDPDTISEVDQSSLSYIDYFQFFSVFLKDLVSKQNSEINQLEITSFVFEFKQYIIKVSPSSSLNIIGSLFEETYIKGLPIDLNFLDFLTYDPQQLLNTAIEAFDMMETKNYSSSLYKKSGFLYKFIINEELAQYNSVLVKVYNGIDCRCKELIFVFKFWTVQESLYGEGFLSGFQISLLVIVFLQQIEPPVLPRLQLLQHDPQLISEFDVWIPADYEFFSHNEKNLAELFHMFLEFLNGLIEGNFVADPKYGLVNSADFEGFLPVLTPFDLKIISGCRKGSEECEKFVKGVKKTLQDLEDKKSFNMIFYNIT